MDADELAATHHEPRVIASALVAVAAAAARCWPGADGVDGATVGGPARAARGGAEALARVQRLLRPPAGLPAGRRALARAAIAALTVAPLLLAAAADRLRAGLTVQPGVPPTTGTVPPGARVAERYRLRGRPGRGLGRGVGVDLVARPGRRRTSRRRSG